MKRIALVTGATSGIGQAIARSLAKDSYKIIACGRRQARLDALRDELSPLTDIISLNFDISKRADVEDAITSLDSDWKNIDILINNAGNAHGLSPIQDGEIEDWEAMMNINVMGLLYLTKAVIPQMISRNTGHILNIGSIAGQEVYANGNVYCASKHAVDAINSGLRLDLNPYKIKVSQIAPGLVETEFSLVRFKGDEERSKAVYEPIEALQAEDIADLAHFIISRPAHVNIADSLILPAAQASATLVRKD